MTNTSNNTVVLDMSEVSAFCAREGWQLDRGRITREYRFTDFRAAFGFMAQAALLFEAADHHPLWTNVYSRVRVKLWTQLAGGLTRRDLEVATELDRLDRTFETAAAA